jgi:F-type H+-transporting ATPase subunit delta
LTADQQAKTLCEVCGDALGAEARNFVAVLAANKRLALLPEIYTLFAQYKANHDKTVDVEVVSAFDLADATRDKLAEVLGKKLERQVEVRTSTDRNLLGGVLIRAGDLVIDGSIRGRLNKLSAAMNS